MNSNHTLSFKNQKNMDILDLVINTINKNKKLTQVDLSNTNFSYDDFKDLLNLEKRENPLHILLCDCDLKLNYEIYDMIKRKKYNYINEL